MITRASRLLWRRSTQHQQHSIPRVRKRHNSDPSNPEQPPQPPQPAQPPTASAEGPATSKTTPPPATVAPQAPLWQRLGPLSKAFNAFGRAQRRRPYVVQFTGSLVVYMTGDLSAQYIGGDAYNPARTLRNMAIGGASSIPNYHWFLFLGRTFNYPSSRALSLAAKVALNQIVFAPLFNSYFFGMQALLSGDTWRETWDHVRRTVPVSWVNSCKVWPAVTAFSFTFVGERNRALFAGVVAIGWQSYLSYLNQRAVDEEGAEAKHMPSSTEGVGLRVSVRAAATPAQAQFSKDRKRLDRGDTSNIDDQFKKPYTHASSTTPISLCHMDYLLTETTESFRRRIPFAHPRISPVRAKTDSIHLAAAVTSHHNSHEQRSQSLAFTRPVLREADECLLCRHETPPPMSLVAPTPGELGASDEWSKQKGLEWMWCWKTLWCD